MSKSLQDQLLSLGLARAGQSRQKTGGKAQKTRCTQPSGQQKSPATQKKHLSRAAVQSGRVFTDEPSLEDAYRLRQQQAIEQAERAREQKRLMDLQRRRLNDDIRDIVMPHRLNDEAAELSRNFLHKGRIRKVRVTAEQLKALNAGMLGLVYLAGGYHIVTPEWAEAVTRLSPEHVPDLSGSTDDRSDEDEDFPVPDDLVW